MENTFEAQAPGMTGGDAACGGVRGEKTGAESGAEAGERTDIFVGELPSAGDREACGIGESRSAGDREVGGVGESQSAGDREVGGVGEPPPAGDRAGIAALCGGVGGEKTGARGSTDNTIPAGEPFHTAFPKTVKTRGPGGQGRGLTKRQEDFCRLYAELLSPAEAAIQAGYSAEGARLTALRLLENRRVRERINSVIGEKQLSNIRETALRGLCRAALADPSGALRLLDCGDEGVSRAAEGAELLCISEIKKQKGGGTEIKFIDRVKALETVCRFADPEGNGKTGIDDLINAVKASAAGDGGDEA